ncbi:MAG: S-adenosylhomocysteine deaminase [Ignavibacteriae bacterium]|nr:MAG: S-adenosylhomocysteine deaminase [Ignavibacteriota bacterium]
MTILIKNGIIITLGEPNKVLYGHSLLIENGLIKKIAPTNSFTGSYDKIIDASGKIVMPGFINAHMHFYSTLVRGYGKAAPSKDFNEVLQNLWWRLDKKLVLEDCYYSTLIPAMNAIRHGTTTLIDHHASPFAVRGSLTQIAKAVKEVGLRASLCYEVSDRDGQKIADEGLEENVDFIKQCNNNNDNQFKALFGLHASFTIGEQTLEKAAMLGKELGVGFHVHTAEAASDQVHCETNHKMRVVERFNKFGILGEKSIAAHCVHINEKEMELLAETKTAVAHNPQSNMNNAVGVADIIKMQNKGVLVGLGTDAMTVNMMEEVRVALWLQHLYQKNPSVGFVEAISTLLFNNSKIANRYWNPKIGELKENYAADVILIDYFPPTPLDESTFLGHFMFGITQSIVDTTIIDGKILMENRKLQIDIDEERINARARELAKELWERM